jgi:hypothetical protein
LRFGTPRRHTAFDRHHICDTIAAATRFIHLHEGADTMKSCIFAAVALAALSFGSLPARVSRAADVPISTAVSQSSDTPQQVTTVRHRGPGGVHHRPYYAYRPPYVVAPPYTYPAYTYPPYVVSPYAYSPTWYPIYPSFVSPYAVGYRFPGARWGYE